MNKLRVTLIVLLVSVFGGTNAQGLLTRVPQGSKVVVAVNGKGFLKHATIDQLNDIFQKLGVFETISYKNDTFNSDNIEDFGIDLKSNSYFFFNVNDSVQYFGALIPLKDRAQFESMIPKSEQVTVVNGCQTVYSNDNTLRVSWNQHSLFVLGGVAVDHYFKQDDVKERFGLLSRATYDWEDDKVASVIIETDDVSDSEVVVDSSVLESDSTILPPTSTWTDEDAFSYVDSMLAREEYQDDYYKEYRSEKQYNDSVINEFIAQMVNSEMGRIISGKMPAYKSKSISSMKDNVLVRMEIQSLDSLLAFYYPRHLLYGIKSQPFFHFGYEKITTSVSVDGNKMKVAGDIAIDPEIAKYYRAIYKHRLNSKVFDYISDDALGFVSLNFNTEAYLKYMPNIVNRIFGGMDSKYAPAIDLATTMFEVLLDEKAISKVFKGDNLLVFNGFTQREVKYIDYEYDEDYNPIETVKTKTENAPNVMWIFSSDDTRIFEKMINLLEIDGLIFNHDGIYEIKRRKSKDTPSYVLIGQGMVFVSNDLKQLRSIKSNNFKSKSKSYYRSVAKKNSVAMLLNTKKIPALIDDLDIPVKRSMASEINNLAQYGDFYILSKGMKGNTLKWESGLEFPATRKNALDFILNSLLNISSTLDK